MVCEHYSSIGNQTLFELLGRFLKNLKQRFQDKLALANNTAEESISNMRTVRAFSNEDKMKTLYDQDIDKSYSLGRKIAFLQGKSWCYTV